MRHDRIYDQSPSVRYEEDKAVVRRLRAWYRGLLRAPHNQNALRVIRSDLTAFLRDEKAKIGGKK